MTFDFESDPCWLRSKILMNVPGVGDEGAKKAVTKQRGSPVPGPRPRHEHLKEIVVGWHCHSLIYVVLAAENL